jgi:hypothetical protein
MPKRIHGGYAGRKQYQKQLDEADQNAKKPLPEPETRGSQKYLDRLSEEIANINIPKAVRRIFE